MTRSVGYSGTPLVKKLGIKPGMRVAFASQPDRYADTLGDLPDGVKVLGRMGKDMDLVQAFVKRRADLVRRFPAWKRAIAKDGMLWVCWPKKASRVATDLDGNTVRTIGLEAGLVDVKVCAVDEVWSGLKFVWRVADR